MVEADKHDATSNLRAEGEVWVWEANYQPVKITLAAGQGEGALAVREEAAVEYFMSDYGVLLPVSTEHRELRAGKVVAENLFAYRSFKKFGASSDIIFEPEPEPAPRQPSKP